MPMIDPEIVDAELGAGEYELYQELIDEYSDEFERAQSNLESFKSIFQRLRHTRLQRDLDIATAIEADYSAYLVGVTNGTVVDMLRAPKIRAVFEASLRVLWVVNTTLEEFVKTGVQSLFVLCMACKLDDEAKKLKLSLKEYEKALKKARLQKNEAWVQLVLDTAITGIGLSMGPVGVLAAAAMGGLSFGIDNAIGVDKNWSDDTSGNMNDAGGTLIDCVEAYDATISATKTVQITAETGATAAKPILTSGFTQGAVSAMGKVSMVAGVFFNVKELSVGYSNISEIEKTMDDARKKHANLMAEYKRRKSTLENLSKKLLKLRKDNEAKGNQRADALRAELDAEILRTGYTPSKGKSSSLTTVGR